MSETREQRLAGIRERATEQMRNIYRSSGHNFSDADIEKLTKDAEWEVEMWAKFADSERERVLLECIAWIRKNCQVDTGDGIYGDASKYSIEEIKVAIHEGESR